MTGTNLQGTNILSMIVPTNHADTYATHDSFYGKGGWREVDFIADRDAIPAERRRRGMVVFVRENFQCYILKNSDTNGGWVPFPSETDVVEAVNKAIADGKISIDLSNYITEDSLSDRLIGVATEAWVKEYVDQEIAGEVDLALYQKKEDQALLTEDKTIVGAINELFNRPVIVDAYTKAEADAKFLTEHQSLADYALKSELPVIPTNISAFVNDIGYLTEHQSLEDYATKAYVSEAIRAIPPVDLTNYATKDDVLDAVSNYDSSNKAWIYDQDYANKAYLAERLSGYVPYTDISTEENLGRKAVVLENHDVILGKTTSGSTEVLAMMSKYNVADFGSKQTHTNLNTQQIVTINDTDAVATDKLLANFLIAGDNVTITPKDMVDPETGFAFKAYEFKATGAGGGTVPEERLAEAEAKIAILEATVTEQAEQLNAQATALATLQAEINSMKDIIQAPDFLILGDEIESE